MQISKSYQGSVVVEDTTALDLQLARQVSHWVMAASRLGDLDDLAAASVWNSLERYMGIVLRQNLLAAVERLQRQGAMLQSQLNAARTREEIDRVRQQLLEFRQHYLRTETLLDFYADALNTRTSPNLAAMLRACDILARRSMSQLLDRLGQTTPPVLTYIDKGLGASILKAGLRLWDGRTESLTAAIKITRHNLYRPTALIHEAGHQVAHAIGWSEEMAALLERELGEVSPELVRIWASWSSEIAADTFAFAHTGYAAVSGLHTVLAGGEAIAFRYLPGDPHPIGYLRILLGTAMCRLCFGSGPWDNLERSWRQELNLARARPAVRGLLQQSLPLLPRIAELTLFAPMRAFRGEPLAAIIDPKRVSPEALAQLEQQAGAALYTSHHWIGTEPLRILALSGYSAATRGDRALEILQQQKDWMLRLGETLKVA